MKLTRDRLTEKLLFDKFRAYLTREERSGIHVSDLVSPLLAYWKRKKPKPLSDEECLYFLSGIAHHGMIEAAVEGTEEVSYTDEDTGVVFSPDLRTLKGEIKTTRKSKIPDSEEACKRSYAEYIKQCKMYTALMRLTEWKLIPFFYSVEKWISDFYTERKPALRAYTITWTETEMERERARIKKLSTDLRQALDTGNPAKLPLCVAWKCYDTVNGKKVGKCIYWDECLPEGRHPSTVATEESGEF